MPRFPLPAYALLAAVTLAACDDAKETAADIAKAAEEQRKKQATAIADKIEREVSDELVCSGKLQPSTLAKLKEALHGGKALGFTDLIESPDVVGPVMGFAGSGLASGLVLALNLGQLGQQGHVRTIVEGGWQAAKCGESVPIQCLTGTATSKVVCTGATVDAVEMTYDKCIVDGPARSGTVRLLPVAGEPTSAKIAFVDYKPSETQRLEGKLKMLVYLGANAAIHLANDGTLTVANHEGARAAKCGDKLLLHTLKLAADATAVTLELDATKQTPGKAYTLRSTGLHLAWPAPPACACPRPQGGIDIGFPAPYGGGPAVTLKIAFGAAQSADTCASASATLAGWPASCKLTEHAAKDCGKGSAEKVATAVAGALCVSVK